MTTSYTTKRLSDIIEPAVFGPFVKEKVSEHSSLVKSGAVVDSEYLFQLVSRGGKVAALPHWSRNTGDSEVLSETAALTANPITPRPDQAAIHYRGKAWGGKELHSALAGDSALDMVAHEVADYWVREEQKILTATLTGIFQSADMASFVYGQASPASITPEMILDAKQLLGDRYGKLRTVVMHSAAYTALQKKELLLLKKSDDGVLSSTFLGFNIIVDDSVRYDATNKVYSAYLLADGAVGRGDGVPVDFTQVEICRDGLKGEDYLIYRKALILHPYGCRFQAATVTGVSPSNTELCLAGNWKRVADTDGIGIVEIRHKL